LPIFSLSLPFALGSDLSAIDKFLDGITFASSGFNFVVADIFPVDAIFASSN